MIILTCQDLGDLTQHFNFWEVLMIRQEANGDTVAETGKGVDKRVLRLKKRNRIPLVGKADKAMAKYRKRRHNWE